MGFPSETQGWMGLWGFLWWAPSPKRKDHHRVSSGWSTIWFDSNTGLSSTQYMGWVGLWGFLWWAPSAKRKDRSGWSSVWHRSNTGLSSTQYEQIPIILGVWPFWLNPFFSINYILLGLWFNCISSVEITLILLADILLQHRVLFQC